MSIPFPNHLPRLGIIPFPQWNPLIYFAEVTLHLVPGIAEWLLIFCMESELRSLFHSLWFSFPICQVSFNLSPFLWYRSKVLIPMTLTGSLRSNALPFLTWRLTFGMISQLGLGYQGVPRKSQFFVHLWVFCSHAQNLWPHPRNFKASHASTRP